MPAAVDDRKGGVLFRIELPDHLLHEQLVKIGIKQAAHNRVEPPAMVVVSGCNICHCHGWTLPRREACNQWVSAGHGRSAAIRALVRVLVLAGSGGLPAAPRSTPGCPGR